MIELVPQDYINEKKWNALLMQYRQTHPYASLHYLNAVCKHWSALVFGDYEAVLPFCWNKKWLIPYVYQPPFLQQMLYVGPAITEAQIEAIKQLLSTHFSFIDLKTNIPLSTHTRKNYLLDLNQPYETLQKNYSSQTKKNVKASKAKVVTCSSIDQFIAFYNIHTTPKIAQWKKEFSLVQQQLLFSLQQHDELLLLAAEHEGRPEAFTAVVRTRNHLVHLMPSSSDKGRDIQGTTAIVDHLIQSYCGQEYILDFEGSEIAGIARFNEGFGAQMAPYFEFKSNQLSFPFNLLKK